MHTLSDALSRALKPIPPIAQVHESHVAESHLAGNGIRSLLKAGNDLALHYFEIDNFAVFAKLYGPDICQEVLHVCEEALKDLGAEFHPRATIFVERCDPGVFLLLCLESEARTPANDKALAIRFKLKSRLKPGTLKLTGQVLDVLAGSAAISSRSADRFEHALYDALCDAQRLAKGNLDLGALPLLNEFRSIISQGLLTSHYQPIVDLESGRIAAWEALARGPRDSYFAQPLVMFDFAEEVGQIFALERACRESALQNLGGLEEDEKLFVNIHPRTLVDPNFSSGETLRLLEDSGLSPDKVVLEITERHRVRDFTLFHRTLDHYRSQGFQVAIDDAGTGYSGLSSIAEIRPEYIKVDMSLVRDIDKNPVKRALIETFLAFAGKIGCKLLAEGIETRSELSCLVQMGVHYGQGYHLGRPALPKARPEITLPESVRFSPLSNGRALHCSQPVADLCEPTSVVPPDMPVSDLKERLEDREPLSAVVVARDGVPHGLVMSHHMDRTLTTRFGMDLYYNRPVSKIMDPHPLVVDGRTPVEKVGHQAMNREKYKIYDHVVVTEQGKVKGLVSVQHILDTLATVQVEMAKGANPLSGLPGNVSIEQEMKRRCDLGAPFSIIYADLDKFKAYNDVYGFKMGDSVLLLTSRTLKHAVSRKGGGEDFLGHVGGDDYIIITSPEKAEAICRLATRLFERLVRGCYKEEDRLAGGIVCPSRDGSGEAKRGFISISLAIVDCQGGCDLQEVAIRSAEMKKYAKSISGNSYVRDRRGPVGPKGSGRTCSIPAEG